MNRWVEKPSLPAAHQCSVHSPFNIADSAFVTLVDGAFSSAAARSGEHLLCRPGCSQCCTGVFAMGPADSLRVAEGFAALYSADPERAARIRLRAQASWRRLTPDFPGDPQTGILAPDTEKAFQSFGNDEVCPVLDPVLGTCDLYAARPYTCRVFGPPLPMESGYAICELCFTHASSAEIVSAALQLEPSGVAESLDSLAMGAGVMAGETILAFVLGCSIPK